MAELQKMATRDAYGKALAELGAAHEDVVVFEADLAAATKTGVFRKAFPDRHFECGIAEGNMMAVAAALPPSGWCRSRPALRCSRPGAPLSRCATPSATRI